MTNAMMPIAPAARIALATAVRWTQTAAVAAIATMKTRRSGWNV